MEWPYNIACDLIASIFTHSLYTTQQSGSLYNQSLRERAAPASPIDTKQYDTAERQYNLTRIVAGQDMLLVITGSVVVTAEYLVYINSGYNNAPH